MIAFALLMIQCSMQQRSEYASILDYDY